MTFTSLPNWQESLDSKLVKRLNRPLTRSGMLDNQMATAIIERSNPLRDRLPLLDQQMQRWAKVVDLETPPMAIVYAHLPPSETQPELPPGTSSVSSPGGSPHGTHQPPAPLPLVKAQWVPTSLPLTEAGIPAISNLRSPEAIGSDEGTNHRAEIPTQPVQAIPVSDASETTTAHPIPVTHPLPVVRQLPVTPAAPNAMAIVQVSANQVVSSIESPPLLNQSIWLNQSIQTSTDLPLKSDSLQSNPSQTNLIQSNSSQSNSLESNSSRLDSPQSNSFPNSFQFNSPQSNSSFNSSRFNSSQSNSLQTTLIQADLLQSNSSQFNSLFNSSRFDSSQANLTQSNSLFNSSRFDLSQANSSEIRPHPPGHSPVFGEGETVQRPSLTLAEGFRVKASILGLTQSNALQLNPFQQNEITPIQYQVLELREPAFSRWVELTVGSVSDRGIHVGNGFRASTQPIQNLDLIKPTGLTYSIPTQVPAIKPLSDRQPSSINSKQIVDIYPSQHPARHNSGSETIYLNNHAASKSVYPLPPEIAVNGISLSPLSINPAASPIQRKVDHSARISSASISETIGTHFTQSQFSDGIEHIPVSPQTVAQSVSELIPTISTTPLIQSQIITDTPFPALQYNARQTESTTELIAQPTAKQTPPTPATLSTSATEKTRKSSRSKPSVASELDIPAKQRSQPRGFVTPEMSAKRKRKLPQKPLFHAESKVVPRSQLAAISESDSSSRGLPDQPRSTQSRPPTARPLTQGQATPGFGLENHDQSVRSHASAVLDAQSNWAIPSQRRSHVQSHVQAHVQVDFAPLTQTIHPTLSQLTAHRDAWHLPAVVSTALSPVLTPIAMHPRPAIARQIQRTVDSPEIANSHPVESPSPLTGNAAALTAWTTSHLPIINQAVTAGLQPISHVIVHPEASPQSPFLVYQSQRLPTEQAVQLSAVETSGMTPEKPLLEQIKSTSADTVMSSQSNSTVKTESAIAPSSQLSNNQIQRKIDTSYSGTIALEPQPKNAISQTRSQITNPQVSLFNSQPISHPAISGRLIDSTNDPSSFSSQLLYVKFTPWQVTSTHQPQASNSPRSEIDPEIDRTQKLQSHTYNSLPVQKPVVQSPALIIVNSAEVSSVIEPQSGRPATFPRQMANVVQSIQYPLLEPMLAREKQVVSLVHSVARSGYKAVSGSLDTSFKSQRNDSVIQQLPPVPSSMLASVEMNPKPAIAPSSQRPNNQIQRKIDTSDSGPIALQPQPKNSTSQARSEITHSQVSLFNLQPILQPAISDRLMDSTDDSSSFSSQLLYVKFTPWQVTSTHQPQASNLPRSEIELEIDRAQKLQSHIRNPLPVQQRVVRSPALITVNSAESTSVTEPQSGRSNYSENQPLPLLDQRDHPAQRDRQSAQIQNQIPIHQFTTPLEAVPHEPPEALPLITATSHAPLLNPLELNRLELNRLESLHQSQSPDGRSVRRSPRPTSEQRLAPFVDFAPLTHARSVSHDLDSQQNTRNRRTNLSHTFQTPPPPNFKDPPALPIVQVEVEPLTIFEPLVLPATSAHSTNTNHPTRQPSATPSQPSFSNPSLTNSSLLTSHTASPSYPSFTTSSPHIQPVQLQPQTAIAASSSAPPIDIDALVAQVERRLMKRFVVESERRGKKKWH